MSYGIEVSIGDMALVDGEGAHYEWAYVTDVHTAGVTVRHTDGTKATYWSSQVLDVEPRRLLT